jgi:hypothetical protein
MGRKPYIKPFVRDEKLLKKMLRDSKRMDIPSLSLKYGVHRASIIYRLKKHDYYKYQKERTMIPEGYILIRGKLVKIRETKMYKDYLKEDKGRLSNY